MSTGLKKSGQNRVAWKAEACKQESYSFIMFHSCRFMICETFIPREDHSSHCVIVHTTGPRNRISETLLQHHIPLQRRASQHCLPWSWIELLLTYLENVWPQISKEDPIFKRSHTLVYFLTRLDMTQEKIAGLGLENGAPQAVATPRATRPRLPGFRPKILLLWATADSERDFFSENGGLFGWFNGGDVMES